MSRPTILALCAVLVFGTLTSCAKGDRRSDESAIDSSNQSPNLRPGEFALGQQGDSATAPDNESKLVIRGALSYRERMALPPGARAIVEIREGSIEDGPVIAERRMNLDGKQVPLAFEMDVPRASFSAGKTYHARGAVFAGGLPAWVSDAVDIDPAKDNIDIGTVIMVRPKPGAFKSVMNCGDESVVVGFNEKAMLLTVGGETFEMQPTEAESGTRYQAVGDPTTTFWNKGDRTTITVKGRTLPECGRGNAAPAYDGARGDQPQLQGQEWIVQSINGESVTGDAPVTLAFGSDGRVSGKASCNGYSAPYVLTGGGIKVSEIVSTMMMCPLIEQEKKFLAVLRDANHFETKPDGSLLLHTEDGRSITARR